MEPKQHVAPWYHHNTQYDMEPDDPRKDTKITWSAMQAMQMQPQAQMQQLQLLLKQAGVRTGRTMKAARMSRMRVMGCTGSLQKSDSIKCCSRRCLNTLTVGGVSPCCTGPQPNLCVTGGRTYTNQIRPVIRSTEAFFLLLISCGSSKCGSAGKEKASSPSSNRHLPKSTKLSLEDLSSAHAFPVLRVQP